MLRSNLNSILELDDKELSLVTGNGIVRKIIGGIVVSVCVTIGSAAVIAEGKSLWDDVKMDNENWVKKKEEDALRYSELSKTKCLASIPRLVGKAHTKVHNKIVDGIRYPIIK